MCAAVFRSVAEGVSLTPQSDVVSRNSRSSLNSDASHRRNIYVFSVTRDSENVMDSILSPTVSLLSDPDVMLLLRKSFSSDNLCESPDHSPNHSDSDSSCDLLDDEHPAVCFIRIHRCREETCLTENFI